MPRQLGHLRILLSSRVVLDLEEADKIFCEKGKQAYTDYLRCEGEYAGQGDPELGGFRRLNKGPLFDVVIALNKLNKNPSAPVVELALSCKDDQRSARAIFRNLAKTPLGTIFETRYTTGGSPVGAKRHKDFGTDLFLTRSAKDAQTAVDLGIAAAVISFPPSGEYEFADDIDGVLLAIDGDAVTFGDSAEAHYQELMSSGLSPEEAVDQYKRDESLAADTPIEAGPFSAVLRKISELNAQFLPPENPPILLGMLTARGADASERALTTAEELNIVFNYESAWRGGGDKSSWLAAHKPHLFFDDTKGHVDRAVVHCPTGLVPRKAGGHMDLFEKKKNSASFDKAAQGVVAVEQDNVAGGPLPVPNVPGNQPG